MSFREAKRNSYHSPLLSFSSSRKKNLLESTEVDKSVYSIISGKEEGGTFIKVGMFIRINMVCAGKKMFICTVVFFFEYLKARLSELQIRGVIEDTSKIIFLISQ